MAPNCYFSVTHADTALFHKLFEGTSIPLWLHVGQCSINNVDARQTSEPFVFFLDKVVLQSNIQNRSGKCPAKDSILLHQSESHFEADR